MLPFVVEWSLSQSVLLIKEMFCLGETDEILLVGCCS